nr:Lrp/AsnC ligand binding domain-containing protein [Halomonas sp.]
MLGKEFLPPGAAQRVRFIQQYHGSVSLAKTSSYGGLRGSGYQKIRQVDEVMECHLISGGYDYLLRFIARSIAHYQRVMEALIEEEIGIEKCFSYIVIKTPINKEQLPLRTLMEG